MILLTVISEFTQSGSAIPGLVYTLVYWDVIPVLLKGRNWKHLSTIPLSSFFSSLSYLSYMGRLFNIVLSSVAVVSITIAQGTPDFVWNSIEPSTKFSWVDCYSDNLQCARFKVPLNYSEPDNGKTAAIAVLKWAAQVPASEHGGAIFVNPGGPGLSGVEAVQSGGETYQSIFGIQFDLIGFDPRGVNLSTPTIADSIFESD
ncbi:hypothetical protein D9758_007303 [Tetrapyrgos nigripes]|uniref:AB hydrolase-1 domain-containing protein n=1 Tax=Tetrapyrgos nigripes TaxID=182062 RepID=A0A8H5GBG5_9AGAR|nr:hypothetical protein D9758_007303 [Tetrapyrgos nigripes]